MKRKLVLIGGGGHCKSCIDVIEQSSIYEIIGILDTKERIGQLVLKYKIIGTDKEIESLVKRGCDFLVTLGQIRTPELRERLYLRLKKSGANIATITSPRAYISEYAQIGEGSIIMHDVIINADASIGKNCIINSKALIEHDAIIGNHCHISTATVINGGVKVKNGSFVGSNSTTKEYSVISEKAFIKAGVLFLGDDLG